LSVDRGKGAVWRGTDMAKKKEDGVEEGEGEWKRGKEKVREGEKERERAEGRDDGC